MTIGTYGLGRVAGNDTKAAVRNVSLLYLYVLPERRNKGVGEQLLMTMEEALSKRLIEKAQVLLSQEQSELGEYLENVYGSVGVRKPECRTARASSASGRGDADAPSEAAGKDGIHQKTAS